MPTPIQNLIAEGADIQTPYYLLDEERLVENMEKIAKVREASGAKAVLATKCFSTWGVFPLMSTYMDGTTSSSLNEVRLGHDKFGKEVHAYSVAYADHEIAQVATLATKVIFNSVSQLERFYEQVKGKPVGLRVNPGISYSHFDLADPARKCSRLGVKEMEELLSVVDKLSGVMFHCHCENDDVEAFAKILGFISEKYGEVLDRLDWVSLGGGIYFTKEGYRLDEFCEVLKKFAAKHNVQVYLEPGESSITRSGYLLVTILDIVERDGVKVAIVDAAVEPHMLDLLIYSTPARMELPEGGTKRYQVAGCTCLAGDIFGEYDFMEELKIGDRLAFADAAGYTMVKKHWFNGVRMPSIAIRRIGGETEVVRKFGYEDYLAALG